MLISITVKVIVMTLCMEGPLRSSLNQARLYFHVKYVVEVYIQEIPKSHKDIVDYMGSIIKTSGAH